MVSEDMIVTRDGKLAKDLTTGDEIDALLENGTTELAPVYVLGAPVFHMCQKITTPSGCEVICSNNALVLIDDPSRHGKGVVNCQNIGSNRIAILRDGVITYEPAVATPFQIVPVCQLLMPGGYIAAGRDPSCRVLLSTPR